MHNLTIANFDHDLARSLQQIRGNPERLHASRAHVERALLDGKAYYGINTGFGALANRRIDDSALADLQRNLLLSHACGVGEPVPPAISRIMLGLKLHSLSLGFSGISWPTFELLLTFWEQQITPWIPSRGSLGASGDLAPLAHLALPLIGRGRVWGEQHDSVINGAEALLQCQREPVKLAAKDGLALINGTQLMSGYGVYVLQRALTLMRNADLLAAMSLEALQGSAQPFDARVHALRPHAGQQQVAANIRRLLADSEILDSHRDCGKVQDPYCLRCVPQVHGASRQAIQHAIDIMETEINSVTDNPLVMDNGDIVSAGNFHGQPLALAMDYTAIALAELASISERRTYLLLEGHDGLPRLLMQDTGVNSGFMIPQYTAAALVSENKVLCHPASVDSIPSSLGQEDHVSMGSISALKLLQVLQNTEWALAVELLTSAQALDFRLPLKPGAHVAHAHARMREHIQHADSDYEVGSDIELCAQLLREGALLAPDIL